MGFRVEVPNLDDLIKAYLAGVSEKELARRAGVSRSVIRRRLLARGIEPRGRSAATAAVMASLSEAGRQARTAPAHDAARGRKASFEELCAKAAAREITKSGSVPLEGQLLRWLERRIEFGTMQKAVGPYNVDVALEETRIAVEVFGGRWHASGRHAARHLERCEYLFDRGWSVVVIWVDARRRPFGVGAVDYIVALSQRHRTNPPSRPEYHVIFGDGEPTPRTQFYLNAAPFVPGAHRGD